MLAQRAVAFSLDKVGAQRVCNAAGYVVLHFHEVGTVAVEAFGPKMGAGLRVDQLSVDPDLVAGFLHGPFQDISHAQFPADCVRAYGPTFVG